MLKNSPIRQATEIVFALYNSLAQQRACQGDRLFRFHTRLREFTQAIDESEILSQLLTSGKTQLTFRLRLFAGNWNCQSEVLGGPSSLGAAGGESRGELDSCIVKHVTRVTNGTLF